MALLGINCDMIDEIIKASLNPTKKNIKPLDYHSTRRAQKLEILRDMKEEEENKKLERKNKKLKNTNFS